MAALALWNWCNMCPGAGAVCHELGKWPSNHYVNRNQWGPKLDFEVGMVSKSAAIWSIGEEKASLWGIHRGKD